MMLRCRRIDCQRVWDYRGKSLFRACCPRCGSTIRFGRAPTTGRIPPFIRKPKPRSEPVPPDLDGPSGWRIPATGYSEGDWKGSGAPEPEFYSDQLIMSTCAADVVGDDHFWPDSPLPMLYRGRRARNILQGRIFEYVQDQPGPAPAPPSPAVPSPPAVRPRNEFDDLSALCTWKLRQLDLQEKKNRASSYFKD